MVAIRIDLKKISESHELKCFWQKGHGYTVAGIGKQTVHREYMNALADMIERAQSIDRRNEVRLSIQILMHSLSEVANLEA